MTATYHPDYKIVRAGIRDAFRELRQQRFGARMDTYWNTPTSASAEMISRAVNRRDIAVVFFNHQNELDFRRLGEVRVYYLGMKDCNLKYWLGEDLEIEPIDRALGDYETGELVANTLRKQPNLRIQWDGDCDTPITVTKRRVRT
jgi:hypothetical protein